MSAKLTYQTIITHYLPSSLSFSFPKNMKNAFSLLLAFVMFAGAAFAQQKEAMKQAAANTPATSTVVAAKASGAKMKFETEAIDYGKILQGADPLRKFYFTNTGSAPLIIKAAKGSCGCTVPTYPREPIMPGERGVIEVRYDTQRVGAFTKTVTITTNADDEKVLTIKGDVQKMPDGTPTKSGSLITPQGVSH